MFASSPDGPGSISLAGAVDAAVAVARESGVEVERPRVLSESNNVIVALDPAPVIARVAMVLGDVRPERGAVHLSRELDLALWTAERGGPVVPPSPLVEPVVHVRDGWPITFWTGIDGDSRASSDEAAPVLRELHELIAEYGGELPVMSPVLDETMPMLEAALEAGGIDDEGARLITEQLERFEPILREPGLPVRPIHGDPHVGNLVLLDGRLVWNDLEDTCRGPIQFDLVCLLRARDGVTAEELAPYGVDIDPASLDPFITGRLIQGAAWVSLCVPTDPDLEELRDRMLGLLRER